MLFLSSRPSFIGIDANSHYFGCMKMAYSIFAASHEYGVALKIMGKGVVA
jgi:hypothetical protein